MFRHHHMHRQDMEEQGNGRGRRHRRNDMKGLGRGNGRRSGNGLGRGNGRRRGRGLARCGDRFGMRPVFRSDQAGTDAPRMDARSPIAPEAGAVGDVCPLCDNHCPLSAPSCKQGRAYAAARNA